MPLISLSFLDAYDYGLLLMLLNIDFSIDIVLPVVEPLTLDQGFKDCLWYQNATGNQYS